MHARKGALGKQWMVLRCASWLRPCVFLDGEEQWGFQHRWTLSPLTSVHHPAIFLDIVSLKLTVVSIVCNFMPMLVHSFMCSKDEGSVSSPRVMKKHTGFLQSQPSLHLLYLHLVGPRKYLLHRWMSEWTAWTLGSQEPIFSSCAPLLMWNLRLNYFGITNAWFLTCKMGMIPVPTLQSYNADKMQ